MSSDTLDGRPLTSGHQHTGGSVDIRFGDAEAMPSLLYCRPTLSTPDKLVPDRAGLALQDWLEASGIRGRFSGGCGNNVIAIAGFS